MKLAVSQPYFFPYIGIFQLIYYTDFFVVFDTVQYVKRSWMNRNRVLHPNKEFNYIVLPVKKSKSNIIKDIEIAKNENWQEKILGQIGVYARKAPYYKEVRELMHECLSIEESNFSSLTIRQMEYICQYLGIKFAYQFLSKMDIKLPKINEPGEWCLYISEALKAKEYVNMPRGAEIYKEAQFEEKNINLRFLNPIIKEYNQKRDNFIPRLSIIDILMWNSKEEVLDMIRNDFDILTKKELLQKGVI